MNITLSISEDLAKRARKTAAARGISLNELIRQELERIAGQADREEAFEDLKRLLTDSPGNSGGWRWDREELHGRSGLR